MKHLALFSAGAAAFAVVMGLAVKPAAAEDPAALLARHKAYVGWAYGDGTLKSVRLTTVPEASFPAPSPKPGATPDPLGRANRKTVELRRELLYRSTTTAYGLEADSEGFTGSVFWRANENGNTVTRRGRDAREALTFDVIAAEALAEVHSSVQPDAPFDGKTAAVLRLEPKTGAPADVYIDRETGALLGYVVEPDVPLERTTVHVIAYAEFATGKRYVAALRFGDATRTYRITAFEPNVAISDADLHPPVPRATWTFGEPRSVPITVVQHSPVYSNGGRAVHVDVSVNGRVGHFLLDSGAGGVLLFEPFARSAGLVNLGRASYTGVNGKSVGATLARVERMQIGGNTLRDLIVQRSSQDVATIAGIIGYDVLAGAVFDVDLTASTLTISDPGGFDAQPKQGAYAFPLDLSDFHAGVPMKVAGNVLPSVWLDTGDDFFVILPHELERKTVAVNDTMVYFGGVDGSGAEPARCVRLNEMQVGPFRYQNALSCFAPNDAFGLDGGLIGFDFLRHFNWTFDYPHGRVVLTPNGL
jgi:predicted aspartyl protease